MHIKIDIGLRIREYLEKKKISQSEVADSIGKSRQTLNSALAKKDVKVLLLLDILKATGGSLDDILPEFVVEKEDENQMRIYMQQLISLQKAKIESLEKELKK